MTKRILAVTLAMLAVFSCGKKKETEQVAETPKKPNIIFIMTDDHALQAISAYGYPISQLAKTPNIDRLAKNGALFTNNFCTNSLCGPSRATILTGKFSHMNGFRMNGDKFDNTQKTLPKYLQEAGYKTAVIGKWHLSSDPTGFDHWDILNDQGNYYNPEFITTTGKVVTDGYATDLITDKSIAWIDENKKGDKPFFLMVHHKAPHRNWMPALRHLNMYDSIQFPIPDTYYAKHEGQPAAQQQLMTIYDDMYEGHDLKITKKEGSPKLAHNPWTNDFDRMTPLQRKVWDSAYQAKNDAFHKANLHGKELAEYKYQRYVQDYLATIASVDEGVGKILDYLDANGLTDNTIVVYTSDQGFYMGENGWFDKRFMYELSMKQPLLIQYPEKIQKGKIVSGMTQNLDFASTFLDYAGVQIPSDFQGKSLRPLLENTIKDDNFRDALYYHYYDYPAFHMVKRHYGVRTSRYKLIHFYDDIDVWEMYDLKTDPEEQHNIYNSPEYASIQKELHARLKELQTEYKVTDKELETTPKEKIDKAYENFKKLRGTPIK
ncbi:sulfatase [Flavobacterium alkalisoli]|uniref:Sulfatase n=1 Tax=Flavobacterium alkalisoli TaxID=2602769 RepID=A0A5B9FTX2_9FLAO|nr:sulfatase [Flavobacterium alkalisoli]QEE49068.1 sulfatase [Flavobacterium alkalisoli]